jgi:hypothetical protein
MDFISLTETVPKKQHHKCVGTHALYCTSSFFHELNEDVAGGKQLHRSVGTFHNEWCGREGISS